MRSHIWPVVISELVFLFRMADGLSVAGIQAVGMFLSSVVLHLLNLNVL